MDFIVGILLFGGNLTNTFSPLLITPLPTGRFISLLPNKNLLSLPTLK